MNFVELKQKAAAHWQTVSAESCCIFVDPGSSCVSDANTPVFNHLVAELAQQKLNARVVPTGSLGWREIEPVVAIQKPGRPRIYYANVTPAIASELLQCVAAGDDLRKDLALAVESESELQGIPPISALPFFKPQNRLLSHGCGRFAAEDIQNSIQAGAYAGLNRALSITPDVLLDELENGLGKDTVAQWRHVSQSSAAKEKYVAAKVTDGGAISKDVHLLEGDPHAALEGLLIAAYAVGAIRAFVCVGPRDRVAKHRVQIALEQMNSAGLAGEGILGSTFNCTIEMREVPRGLGGGEESILTNFLEGRPARASVPFPPGNDCRERAVVESVESLVKVSAVMRDPSQADAIRDTKILAITGCVQRTGVIEVAPNTSLGDVVNEMAGGATAGCDLKAVQFGAPVGGWVVASNLGITLEESSLAGAGCSIGSGSLVVADTTQCAVDLARVAAAAAHQAACGQCTFGREGTRQLMDVLTDLCRGRAKDADVALLTNISDSMKLGSLCVNGRRAPDAVITTLQHFRAEYEAHVGAKQCPTEVCEMK